MGLGNEELIPDECKINAGEVMLTDDGSFNGPNSFTLEEKISSCFGVEKRLIFAESAPRLSRAVVARVCICSSALTNKADTLVLVKR